MVGIRILLIIALIVLVVWFVYSLFSVMLKPFTSSTPAKKTKCTSAHLSLINSWLNDGRFFGMLGIGTRKIIEKVFKEKSYTKPEKKVLNEVKKAWIMYNKMKTE